MDITTFYSSLPSVARALSSAADAEQAVSRLLLPTRAHSIHVQQTINQTMRRYPQLYPTITATDLLLCTYCYYFLGGARAMDKPLLLGKPSNFFVTYLAMLSAEFGVEVLINQSNDRLPIDISSVTMLFSIDSLALVRVLAHGTRSAHHPQAVYHVFAEGSRLVAVPAVRTLRAIAQRRAECVVELSGRLSPGRRFLSAAVSWSD